MDWDWEEEQRKTEERREKDAAALVWAADQNIHLRKQQATRLMASTLESAKAKKEKDMKTRTQLYRAKVASAGFQGKRWDKGDLAEVTEQQEKSIPKNHFEKVSREEIELKRLEQEMKFKKEREECRRLSVPGQSFDRSGLNRIGGQGPAHDGRTVGPEDPQADVYQPPAYDVDRARKRKDLGLDPYDPLADQSA